MIRIVFEEPADDDWISWREECERATATVIREFQRTGAVRITDLYKDPRMKRFFEDKDGSFAGKCVYCESDTVVNQPGDVEHFRPKGPVKGWDEQPIVLEGGERHPGYYWLAYDWHNLLYACNDCNRINKKTGTRIGKWDYFPVRNTHASQPGAEVHENPILINPAEEDPSAHLHVSVDGILIADSDRGDECIRVFGLNLRVSLVKARRDAIRDAKMAFKLAVTGRLGGGGVGAETQEKMDQIRSGRAPYAIAARVGLEIARNEAHEYVEETANQ